MHSVDPSLFRGKTRPIDYSIIPNNCQLAVITGGEPTLFDLASIRHELLKNGSDRIIEVESNATRFPSHIVDDFFWNLSPKLKSSDQKSKELDNKRLVYMKEWSDYSKHPRNNVIFKFVIASPSDQEEALEIISNYAIPNHKVYLMAEGTTPESQSLNSVAHILEFAKIHGFNFSPRLHVIFWGNQRGV